jgi:hypothetical protein
MATSSSNPVVQSVTKASRVEKSVIKETYVYLSVFREAKKIDKESSVHHFAVRVGFGAPEAVRNHNLDTRRKYRREPAFVKP